VIERFTGLPKALGVGRLSTGEYKANLNGINIFFGTVLGLVLTGAERLASWQFGVLLMMLSCVVITILYISSSTRRITYSVLALGYAIAFPEVLDAIFGGQGMVPDKIRPTLIVWTLMTVLVEFWAREKTRNPKA
jgi:hypothetical protein